MRKLISFALLIVLLLTSSTALALDLTYVESLPEYFQIQVSESSGNAFISTTIPIKNSSFIHKYESDFKYSHAKFDVLILNYGTDEAYPLWRLCIQYCTESQYQNFESVTFEFDGQSYTFTGISHPELFRMSNSTFVEEKLILFDKENMGFIVALEDYEDKLSSIKDFKCKMILHGDEDIIVDLGEGFLTDLILTETAYGHMDGLASIDKVIGNPMVKNDNPLLAVTQYITITNSSANIRSGPDASYAKVKTAVKGDTFPLLGEENGWYMIDVNGQTGYVSMKLCKIQ